MKITLLPAITLGHQNNLKSPDIRLDELSYTTHIIGSIHTQLMESAKHTPFITISKLTGTTAQITEQLKQLTQTTPASSNCIIAVGLNSAIDDGHYHTPTGWTVINSPQSRESERLATALAQASIDILGSRAISPQGQMPSHRYINQAAILDTIQAPAVLTLNLYQDNRRDTAYLLSDKGRQAIIDQHVKGKIFNLAIMNNKSLMKLAAKCVPNVLIRTKSVDYETDAVIYLLGKNGIELIDSNNAEWLVVDKDGRSYSFYSNSDWNVCVYDAIDRSESTGKENGGYAWDYDGSGVTIVDHEAEEHSMYLPHWIASPLPSLDFHVHPSGNLQASEDDYNTWTNKPWGVTHDS